MRTVVGTTEGVESDRTRSDVGAVLLHKAPVITASYDVGSALSVGPGVVPNDKPVVVDGGAHDGVYESVAD